MRLIDADNLDEYFSVWNGKLATVGPWNGAIKHIKQYAPTVEAIPVSWIDYHIKVEEMHGNEANAEALKWIRNEWKRGNRNNDN